MTREEEMAPVYRHRGAIIEPGTYEGVTVSVRDVREWIDAAAYDELLAALAAIVALDDLPPCDCWGECRCDYAEAKRLAQAAIAKASGR